MLNTQMNTDDRPAHEVRAQVRQVRIVLAAVPRIVSRYRSLRDELYLEPTRFYGAGVALGPFEGDAEPLVDAIDELGVRSVLVRVYPWEEDHQDAVEARHARPGGAGEWGPPTVSGRSKLKIEN